ncbi:uncharacterized protein [Ptychodera flava]|uniref:uncharacterized protein n=1 Tax=Ptychodera flava TaxID=63121 RepID=UPI00396A108D
MGHGCSSTSTAERTINIKEEASWKTDTGRGRAIPAFSSAADRISHGGSLITVQDFGSDEDDYADIFEYRKPKSKNKAAETRDVDDERAERIEEMISGGAAPKRPVLRRHERSELAAMVGGAAEMSDDEIVDEVAAD